MKLLDGREVTVRRYQEQDAEAIVSLIRRNFQEVNILDYGEAAVKDFVETLDVYWFKGVASYATVYVFCIEEEVIGVGSISSFWGSLTESILLTIFV